MDEQEIAARIEARRQEVLAGKDNSDLSQYLKLTTEITGGLLVWGDFSGWYALRTDLTIVLQSEEHDLAVTEAPEKKRHFILALAARKYPELAELKPKRTEQSIDCDWCKGGQDYPIFAAKGFECECGGLGWIPTECGQRLGSN